MGKSREDRIKELTGKGGLSEPEALAKLNSEGLVSKDAVAHDKCGAAGCSDCDFLGRVEPVSGKKK